MVILTERGSLLVESFLQKRSRKTPCEHEAERLWQVCRTVGPVIGLRDTLFLRVNRVEPRERKLSSRYGTRVFYFLEVAMTANGTITRLRLGGLHCFL
jgi:hypothetical protein